MKALEKERDRRYGTPSELAADIGRYLRHEPVLARAPSLAYRTRKYVRRHRLGVAVASGLALLLIGFAATMAVQTRRIARARHEAEVQRSRAERRLQDVRKLATSFVFDFHDAIANLAGATAARQLVVSKGLEYLDRLAADSEQRPIVAGRSGRRLRQDERHPGEPLRLEHRRRASQPGEHEEGDGDP